MGLIIMKYILFVAGAIALVCHESCATAQNNKTCDWTQSGITPIPDLNLERLVNKKWYVQEVFVRRAEHVLEPTATCLMQHLSVFFVEDVPEHLFIEQYTPVGGDRVATHNSSHVTPEGNSGEKLAVWSVTPSFEWDQYTTIFTHTDYESYGIMHWCPFPDTAVDQPYERILTFTGIPNPDEALVADLRLKVAALGFPTEFAVQIQHHPDCDYELCQSPTETCCDPAEVNVPPMTNLQLDQIQLKLWYAQEIFFREEIPTDFVTPSCVAQIILPYFDFDMTMDERFTNPGEDSSRNIYLLRYSNVSDPGWDQRAVWDVTKMDILNKFKTLVTHTDYSNYLLLHWCPFLENVDGVAERFVVLTSSQNPGEALMSELRGLVVDIGFPTNFSVPIAHHADCDYDYVVDDDGNDAKKKPDVDFD